MNDIDEWYWIKDIDVDKLSLISKYIRSSTGSYLINCHIHYPRIRVGDDTVFRESFHRNCLMSNLPFNNAEIENCGDIDNDGFNETMIALTR